MLDLIIRNVVLPDERSGQDVGVKDGRIVEIRPDLDIETANELDGGGYLLSPPFVDCHFHMDATLSYGRPRVNASGTLLEGIALWGELKPELTHAEIKNRAHHLCRWAIAKGNLAIRTHVDICVVKDGTLFS